jgi:hypothetical protein
MRIKNTNELNATALPVAGRRPPSTTVLIERDNKHQGTTTAICIVEWLVVVFYLAFCER